MSFKIGRNKIVNKTYKYFPKSKTKLQQIIISLISKYGKDADLNEIDTSEITDMSELFSDFNIGKINISDWNVSQVRNMNAMFAGNPDFNCDLSNWDVSKVKDMRFMFYNCVNFIGEGLENWNVEKVEDISNMFQYCHKFTGKSIENWNLKSIKFMYNTFAWCSHLDCNLEKWTDKLPKNVAINNIFKGCSGIFKEPSWA